MLEDKEDKVRETAVKALALVVALCEDADKYNHCVELALGLLEDSCTDVINSVVLILFPVLARWSLDLGIA